MAAVTPDFNEIVKFAIELARDKAGPIIKEASKKRLQQLQSANNVLSEKKNSVDLVTETDQRVEEIIKKSIAERYPEHRFIGEESVSAAGTLPALTDEPTWIVDPIDGTTNFVHSFPNVCISIGLAYKKVPTVGVIYNPFMEHLYHGVRGQGAFFNESTRLPFAYPNALPLKSLAESLIAVEWGSDRSKKVMDMKTRSFVRLTGDSKEIEGGNMCRGLRSLGSAALNFSHVAEGTLDLYWEIGCWAWDVCAGVVIASEAGGKCYGRNGVPFKEDGQALMGRHFLVIRAIGDTPEEKGSDAQDRLAKTFFQTVEEWDA